MFKHVCKSSIYAAIALFLLTGYGCTTTKNASKKQPDQVGQTMKENETNTWPASFGISPRTKIFLNQIKAEIDATASTIESYIPSDKLIEEYGLRQINDVYTISGFVKTTDAFEESQLEAKGVNFGSKAGEIRTISLPISFLPEFLQSKTISYFEISNKVQLKTP
ncbi:MAG: hypothetical protein RBR87_02675 [Bacteroidales bacterium]|jgi:hypothetical protein|nr:hypothetical protein [Bacteroidales bacterium]